MDLLRIDVAARFLHHVRTLKELRTNGVSIIRCEDGLGAGDGNRTRIAGLEEWEHSKIIEVTSLITRDFYRILSRAKVVWALYGHYVVAALPNCAVWVLVRGPRCTISDSCCTVEHRAGDWWCACDESLRESPSSQSQ